MKIIDAGNRRAIADLVTHDTGVDRTFERRVRGIVDRVRVGGDAALEGFARRFDNVTPPLEVPVDEIRRLAAQATPDVRRALRAAARNIARVAARQMPKHFDLPIAPGVMVEQRVEPIASVGCYVPGGRFPLPSSLLMTAVPARVAGVPDVIVVCPRPEPPVMAAAIEAGVSRVFRMGARTPSPRWHTARQACRASTKSSDPATATLRPPRRSSPPIAPSTSTRDRPKS